MVKFYTPQEWNAKHAPQPVSLLAYDNAMEEYLTTVRTERGYTLREPSDYVNSRNPRWAQDAIDWIEFRDDVMEYGLNVQNEFALTGNVPDLSEFISNMPKMKWTFE